MVFVNLCVPVCVRVGICECMCVYVSLSVCGALDGGSICQERDNTIVNNQFSHIARKFFSLLDHKMLRNYLWNIVFQGFLDSAGDFHL